LLPGQKIPARNGFGFTIVGANLASFVAQRFGATSRLHAARFIARVAKARVDLPESLVVNPFDGAGAS